jgi:hypothetical protein
MLHPRPPLKGPQALWMDKYMHAAEYRNTLCCLPDCTTACLASQRPLSAEVSSRQSYCMKSLPFYFYCVGCCRLPRSHRPNRLPSPGCFLVCDCLLAFLCINNSWSCFMTGTLHFRGFLCALTSTIFSWAELVCCGRLHWRHWLHRFHWLHR